MIDVEFNVKYGKNTISIPVNEGKELYPDGGNGLSNLFSETFTIINQIPQSQGIATKAVWKKHSISMCDRRDGIFDKSSSSMAYRANAWTVFCKDWETYKPPLWANNGYYTLADDEKDDYWTANTGDLIIFAAVDDVAPTTIAEFQKLVTKYKDNGGTITSAQSYIHYKPNGTPWRTNHIEMVKG